MSCIYQVCLVHSFKGKLCFLIHGFNIVLSSTMALVYSIELHINTWKWNFDIHFIYVVYARHIPPPYIYMEYTWYIPTIYLVGVPVVAMLGCDKPLNKAQARRMRSVAPTLGWPPFLSWLESHVPALVKYIAVIIIALVASTLIVSMVVPRVPTGGHHASRRITEQKWEILINFVAKPIQWRNTTYFWDMQCHLCPESEIISCRSALRGKTAAATGGACTFSDVADLEAQLHRSRCSARQQ
jgi:hypothetical protein